MLRALVVALVATLPPAQAVAQGARRPLQIDEFLAMDRVAEPEISPDGRWVAYTVIRTVLDSNVRRSDVWLAPVEGGAPRRVTDAARGGRGPRWSPDGRSLAYVTDRGGPPQVRIYSPATRRSRTATGLSTGADGVVWAPTGSHLAFASEVFPDCPDDACNRRREEEVESAGSSARVYEELLFRHWNRWEDGRRSHLFVVRADGGQPADVTAGLDADVPVPPFGGSSDYAFHPDGRTLFYTTKLGHDRAWHTNSDVYRVAVDGAAAPVNLTQASAGADQHPAPSPDGRWLAYLSQERTGFESDRWRLMLLDLASLRVRELTQGFDRSVDDFRWLSDSRGLVLTAQDRQRAVLYRVDLGGRVEELLRWGNSSAVSVAGDGRTLAFVNDAVDRPGQVYVWRVGDGVPPRALTALNTELLARVAMRPAEGIQWVGADGETVHGLVVRPPQFVPGRWYPMVVLLHGGPQSAWLDAFHSRWNAQLFAAPGYVTVLLNPRGSTGFGQRFVDQVSRDWGGRVFLDVMSGVEHAARLPYVDSTRIAAAGGSYGGYLVNWIAGHSDRFDALVSHAGVYDLEAFYGATEELWFPEWEFAGPPWERDAEYERWSPHRFADRFRAPMLVLHGARDFRVPDTQGLALFTALRRRGVPARLVYFPDEGHWIGRPGNQRRWWGEVHAWLARYLGPAETP
jgi:dipeptidyl aminopeptidase/acylaminoacyl peptidase